MKRILTALAFQALLSGCAVGEENTINNSRNRSLEKVVSTESSPIKRSSSLITNGNHALERKDYLTAITNYQEFFALNDSAGLHLDLNSGLRMDAVRERLADSYLSAGENREAFEFLKESLEYYPNDREISGLYEVAATRLRDELTDKLRKDESIQTRLMLGETLYALGEFNLAEDQANSIIRNNKSSGEAYNLLGIINLKKAEFSSDKRKVYSNDAIQNFEEARSLGIKDSEIFYNLSLSYIHKNMFDEAEQVLDEGIKLHPESDKLCAGMARVYFSKSEITSSPEEREEFRLKASEYFNTARSIKPERAIYRGAE